MKSEYIIEMLKSLGSVRFREYSGWVSCDCPLAPWTHRSKQDHNPSFNVSVSDTGTSVFFCYTCSDGYLPLGHLIGRYWKASGEYPTEAANIFSSKENKNQIANSGRSDKELKARDIWDEFIKRMPVSLIPDPIINRFPLLLENLDSCDRAYKYITEERGISKEAIDWYGVRVFPLDNTMVFPMTNLDGDIIVLQSRVLGEKRIDTISADTLGIEWMEFPKLSEVGAWFGLHKVNWKEPLLIVEGCFDAMKAHTFGYKNCIAAFGAHVTKAQADCLHARSYILGFDSDDSGRKGHRQLTGLLGKTAPISYVDWDKQCGAKDCGDIVNAIDFWGAIENRSYLYKNA